MRSDKVEQASDTGAAVTELGWVIEHGASEVSRPSYWAGTNGWSYDHLLAVRFARKDDAAETNLFLIHERYPTAVGMPNRICEHAWDEDAELQSSRATIDGLRSERDEARDEGADFVLDRLAKALGLERWTQHDGSETWDGDVAATLMHILYDAKVIDPEDNSRVSGGANG